MTNHNFNYENRFQILFNKEEYAILNQNVIGVSTPSIDMGNTIQPTAIRNIYIPGNSLEFSDLTITFLLDENYSNYIKILKWIQLCRNFDELDSERIESDITLVLLNNKYKSEHSIVFQNCYPFSLSELPLNTQISETEPINFVGIFKINGMKVE